MQDAKTVLVRALAACLCAGGLLLAAGCGGVTPGFSPMNDDLRDTSSAGSALRRRPRAARFWPVDRWRAAPLKATVVGHGSDRVGEVAVAWREVTFASEPIPGNEQRIYAVLVTPGRDAAPSPRRPGAPSPSATPRSRPALVLVHGLGETASLETAKEWAARGYAVLTLDLPGRGPGREQSRSTGPDFSEEALFKVTPAPTESYLFHAVGAVVRGLQWLREQEGVDRQRVALMGSGWGAVIARLAAAADDRARALVLIQAAGNIESGPAGERLRALAVAERATWRTHFDPISYAADDSPPALFVTATGVDEFPLDAFVAAVRAHRGPGALVLAPSAGRELDAGARAAVRGWLDRTLRGAPGAVPPRSVRERGETVTVEIAADAPVRSVSLFVAEGTGSGWTGREWREVKATRVDDRSFRAALPREKNAPAPLYFVRVTDARGAALAALPPTPAPTVARGRNNGR